MQTLLGSKKFITAIIGVIGVVVNELFGEVIDEAAMLQIVSLLGVFIFGQGLADYGKESAKIDAEAYNTALYEKVIALKE
jgi:hypothetical protein